MKKRRPILADQRPLQMRVIEFQLVGRHQLGVEHRGGLELFHLGRLALGRQPRHAHLVGEHLDRGRQVQRAELGIGGDMHMELAALQFFVGQTRIFAPEYQGHLAIRLQVLQAGRRALARIQQRPGNPPVAGAGAEHHAAAAQGLFQGVHHPCGVEDVGGAGSPRHRVAVGKAFRLHQHQLRQAHVLHGTGRPADVAGMTGVDQHHTNTVEQRRCSPTPSY